MSDSGKREITKWLLAWSQGDQTALEKLAPLVHQELHRLAGFYMRGERQGHTLQTTALVNEAYVKLINAEGMSWQNRAHFYAVAAKVMRHILVDFARSRGQLKRGGEAHKVSLDEALTISPEPAAELVAVHEALNALARLDQRQSDVVELRFFGGLTEAEIGEVLNISRRTVTSEWNVARSWLLRELRRNNPS
jgi:RNA polymerase sigma-70 factor, ECF subfamily